MAASDSAQSYRRQGTGVRAFVLAAFCCVLAQASSAYAQRAEGCPWLNAATAAGVLGTEVRMALVYPAETHPDMPNGAPADVTCVFTALQAAPGTELRIAVHTMLDPHREFASYVSSCGATPRRLVGVGNEAVACTLPHGQEVIDQVVGRVRQRVFVLTWTMSQAASASEEEKLAIRDTLQNTSEQIAGSLF